MKAIDVRKEFQKILKTKQDGIIQLIPKGETLLKFEALAKADANSEWEPDPNPTPSISINTIIDINHDNDIDFDRVKAAGIVAIIHKATQGTTFEDEKYHMRKAIAKNMGFLWGAYHFSTGTNATQQAQAFLDYAKPEPDELISLDWEESPGPDMTTAQATIFCQAVRDRLGRYPCIYGGALLRESVGTGVNPTLSNCPLWYCRVNSTPVGIPQQIWKTYTLWQYTDGVKGPQPRKVDGCFGADRNIFQGDEAALNAAWPFTFATVAK